MDFLFDSWLQSWRTSPYAGVVPNHLYYEVHRVLIEDLLARGAMVVVATPRSDQSRIEGWACSEVKDGVTVLHYLYTRGNATLIDPLLDALPGSKPGFITHSLPDPRFRTWRWVPEMARRKDL